MKKHLAVKQDISPFLADYYNVSKKFQILQELKNLLLSKNGVYTIPVTSTTESDVLLGICNKCNTSLQNDNMPKYAIANGLVIGELPKEMTDLSIEEKSLCSAATIRNCVFVQTMSNQHFINKHSIIFKNDPAVLVKKLPKPINNLDETVNLYIASDISHKERSKLLKAHQIRLSKVRAFLEHLTQNNKNYKQHAITVDYDELNNVPFSGTANCTINEIQPNNKENTQLDAL